FVTVPFSVTALASRCSTAEPQLKSCCCSHRKEVLLRKQEIARLLRSVRRVPRYGEAVFPNNV
ncbi:MAG TPA: hypothetical protein VJ372_15625, partial [Pyrinomonadaceae bacterium]|nr:hypothetical protein [Pyrinomonadaceae bacterium]